MAVIDDDGGSRRGLTALLKQLGCHCEAYESVRAFLHAHAIRRVDCIILDIAMPDIDGLSAHHALRETNYTGPIIFCSGYSEDDIREQARHLGPAHFLQKPVKKTTLRQALESALAASRRPIPTRPTRRRRD